MARFDFDLFTIGAGSGGVAGSRRSGSHGAKVGIAEAVRVGGTCVLRGCVPKKLLVYGAEFVDGFEDSAGFGWSLGERHFDWARLIAAKDKELDRLHGIYVNLLKGANVAIFDGHARLVDPHTVEVAGKRVTAAHIMVATGGHPEMLDVPGIEHAISSNEALDLKALPKRVLIVGGGYIAVEFAGIFGTLGSTVTMAIRAEHVLRHFDHDVRIALTEELTARGIKIRARAHVSRIDKKGGELAATVTDGTTIVADAILYATGRKPNTRNLGLAEVGVRLNHAGAVAVDAEQRTSVPHIYAIGDVTDRLNLTPVAIAEGRAIAETLFNKNPMTVDHHNVPTAVFSQPPVGTVGLAEHVARERVGSVDVYRARFRPMKYTLSGRQERTMMKLVVDRKTDRVLGCHMVGRDAPEITQGLAIALQCGATKRQFDRTIGIHPTAAEEFVTMRDKVPEPKADMAAE
ncbi:MAG: glutathione-disulfide reductase [Stellaceae bacterium]